MWLWTTTLGITLYLSSQHLTAFETMPDNNLWPILAQVWKQCVLLCISHWQYKAVYHCSVTLHWVRLALLCFECQFSDWSLLVGSRCLKCHSKFMNRQSRERKWKTWSIMSRKKKQKKNTPMQTEIPPPKKKPQLKNRLI